jgi:hypothetical protein
MPAETWIDFKKDMLYLSFDFCLTALEHTGTDMYDYAFIRFNTGRKQPYGYLYKELSHDIQKVKDLAISVLRNLGSKGPWMKHFEIFIIAYSFGNLERVTLVDAQYTPDCAAVLGFADRSPYLLLKF